MTTLTRSVIQFTLSDKKLVEFTIYHDLPKIKGLSIKDAVENWLARTDLYTAESLIDYILLKETANICMTEKAYQAKRRRK